MVRFSYRPVGKTFNVALGCIAYSCEMRNTVEPEKIAKYDDYYSKIDNSFIDVGEHRPSVLNISDSTYSVVNLEDDLEPFFFTKYEKSLHGTICI